MAKGTEKTGREVEFERARDELWSHILSCGVLEAAEEHKKDWFDDTMEYLADRYERLRREDLSELRVLGERFCKPVVRQVDTVAAAG